MQKSPLQIARSNYQPKMPVALSGNVRLSEGAATQSVADQEEIKKTADLYYADLRMAEDFWKEI